MGTLARDDFYENASPAANFHGLKTAGSRATKSRYCYYKSTAGWNDANAFNETLGLSKKKKLKIIIAV